MPRQIYPNPEPNTTFAGWRIIREIPKDEYADYGIQGTHNKHYLCENLTCGNTYCMEKTTIRRYENRPSLHKCTNCNGTKAATCYYSKQNGKTLTKPITRNYRLPDVGEDNGYYRVLTAEHKTSNDFSDHNIRIKCECIHCGKPASIRFDYYREATAHCTCPKEADNV